MADLNLPLLKQLCETPAVPSREDAMRDLVVREIRPLVDDLRVDVLGNLIATRRGARPRVMLAAHMDEIGFLVRHIDDKGFVRLQPVGGFDPRTLVAQRVVVHGFAGQRFVGALQPGTKPIHVLDPSEVKPLKLEDLFVDLGMSPEAVRASVEVGDMVTLDRGLEPIGDCVVSRALDDRVGLFVMIEAMRAATGAACEIVAVATTQEEVGLRGARTSAHAVEPDVSVALDVTLAVDTPGGSPEAAITELGKGVALKVMDSSHISSPKLVRHFRDLADAAGIPYQLELLPRGGTDAGAMQLSRGGSSAITISIPTRYVHTVNEMASQADIAGAIDLLARFLAAAGDRDYGYAV